MTSYITELDSTRQQYEEFIISLRRLMDIASDLTFFPSQKQRLISLKSELGRYLHSLKGLKNAWNDPTINEDLDFIVSNFRRFYDNVKRLVEKENLYKLNDRGPINSVQIENSQTACLFLLVKRQEIENRIRNISLNSLQESYIEKLEEIYKESYSYLERYRIDYCEGAGRLYRGLNSYDIEKERLFKMLPEVVATLKSNYADYEKYVDSIYKSWHYQNVEMAKEIEWFKEIFEKMTLSDLIKDGHECRCLLKELYKPFCEFFEKRYNEKVETII